MANVVFGTIHDRKERLILSVRDQNTYDEALRKKRLITLFHLFLVHRYKASSAHYVSPTEDNRYQTAKMKDHGIFSQVSSEIGDIIVASVNSDTVDSIIAEDNIQLGKFIAKEPLG